MNPSLVYPEIGYTIVLCLPGSSGSWNGGSSRLFVKEILVSDDANSNGVELAQLKAIGWAVYFAIALIYAIYTYAVYAVSFSLYSVGYCLGRGLVWPLVLIGSIF
jgi:hypothetical protein